MVFNLKKRKYTNQCRSKVKNLSLLSKNITGTLIYQTALLHYTVPIKGKIISALNGSTDEVKLFHSL